MPGTRMATFTYMNHRGVTEQRNVRPIMIWYGETQWHPKKQWMLNAWCQDRNAERDFAFNDIKDWI